MSVVEPPDPPKDSAILPYWKVFCPACRQMPGLPCVNRENQRYYYLIHIVRIQMWENLVAGTRDENGNPTNETKNG